MKSFIKVAMNATPQFVCSAGWATSGLLRSARNCEEHSGEASQNAEFCREPLSLKNKKRRTA
jgi:hypothetical protein